MAEEKVSSKSSQFHELANPPTDAISCLQFSPSGNRLAVGSWDGHVYVYQRTPDSASPFALERDISDQASPPVLDLCWGSDDDTIYIVGLDKMVCRVQVSSGEIGQFSKGGHFTPSNKVVYSREHNLVLSTSWGGYLLAIDAEDESHLLFKLPAKPAAIAVTAEYVIIAMAGRKVWVETISFFKDQIKNPEIQESNGDGAQNKTIVVPADPFQDRESSLKFMTRAVACMPDGTGYAISSIEGRVGVEWLDPDLQSKTYAFKCHRRTETTKDEEGQQKEVDVVYPVNALAFHPTYGTFVTGGGDGTAALWDAQTKRRVKQYQRLGSGVNALDFSQPDGKFLAVGVSPCWEDGIEELVVKEGDVKVLVREFAQGEAKGKPAKEKAK